MCTFQLQDSFSEDRQSGLFQPTIASKKKLGVEENGWMQL